MYILKLNIRNTMLFNQKAFTLLELITVIIIVAVLTTLALPRYFSSVEYSKSMEASVALGALRQSVERCYLMSSGSYLNCDISNLDITDPSTSINAHFTYSITDQSQSGFTLAAIRNTHDGGDGTSTITVIQTSAEIKRNGSGIFKNIQ
jgi:prepilin-type N-terminal cleavage/methylation domain-containing protein